MVALRVGVLFVMQRAKRVVGYSRNGIADIEALELSWMVRVEKVRTHRRAVVQVVRIEGVLRTTRVSKRHAHAEHGENHHHAHKHQQLPQ